MRGLLVVLCAGALACGCRKATTEREFAGASSGSGRVVGASESGGLTSPPSANYDDARYALALVAAGPYKRGERASFKVVLRAKGVFHVNDEYPTRFVSTASSAVVYPQARFARASQPEAFASQACADAKGSCVLELTVPFTPEQGGPVTLGGDLSFGLCDRDNCVFDKKTLASVARVD